MAPFLIRPQRALPVITAVVLSLIAPLALPLTASAQSAPDADASAGTGIARISVMDGDVAVARGDSDTTVAAAINAPIIGGDYITTGSGARAEIAFDGPTAVRLGGNVQLHFARVDNDNRQLQLAAGTIDLRLLNGTDGQSAIDTPSVSVVPRASGSYRVTVDEDGTTLVTVRSGSADIDTPAGSRVLEPGTTLRAEGAASDPHIQMQAEVAADSFDTFNRERDQIANSAQADSPYVNPEIAGVGDLNGNGNWVDDGSNGNVWIPSGVAPGWAPYRNGNWVWEPSYGWTWVAAEPWGWAPFHYGRWYFSSAYHQWAWYPPARTAFVPAWSPALVGFVGFNIGAVSVGVGFGNIGWVPLAPYEAFHPWWGHGATVGNSVAYFNNNATNVHYRNLQVNNAFTSVTTANFRSGNFGHPVVYSGEALRGLTTVPIRGTLPVVPTQANLRFSQRSSSLAVQTSAFSRRSFAGGVTAVARTPFATQQQSVERATRVAYHPAADTAFANSGPGAAGSYARPDQPTYARPDQPSYAHPDQSAYARPVQPSYARPAQPGAAGGVTGAATRTTGNDPWARFRDNRGVSTLYGTEPHSQYAPPASETRPGAGSSGYYHPAATPGYDRAFAPQASYQRPAGVSPSYGRPSYPQASYARPAAPQRPTYAAPRPNASGGRYGGTTRNERGH